ncbi:hypothetical protein QTP88_020530 [Uroleucon formosanum]
MVFTEPLKKCDPVLWKINEFTIEYICINGFSQELNDSNLTKSKRAYTKVHKGSTKTYYRFCNKNFLNTKLTNGDSFKRNFISCSKSKSVVYCVPCLLFGNINSPSFASKGFSNWKRADELISLHENSLKHCSNILSLKNRGQTLQRIDQQIIQQIENERMYWINVLKRIVAIVKTLALRGLAFKGRTSKIGCSCNGNFMMALELLAEFDPFISNHISKNSNPGKGHTSYLSYYIYEQFILIMSKKVENTIIQDINNSRYFSISVDSTPVLIHILFSINLPFADFKLFNQENVRYKVVCRDDACYSLNKNWSSIENALNKIGENKKENTI